MAMTILKNGPIHAVVVFVNHSGQAIDTLDLDALAISGSQTPVAPKVNIKAIHYSNHANAHCTITRNNVLLWDLCYSGNIPMNGFSDSRENTHDIVVDTSSGGTVVLELMKVDGYGDSQHIPSV